MNKIKLVHLEAFLVWLVYDVVTKGSFVATVSSVVAGANSFILNIGLSVFFGLLFLYFFSHEDFFKFISEIERKNRKAEKQWENRFAHYSKLLVAFVIGVIAGPLIGALSVRFLLTRYKFKYLVVLVSSCISALVWITIARGVIIWHLPR